MTSTTQPRRRHEGTFLANGTMVDHFRVLRPIGRGGMGQVYLARDTQLGRRVALKLLRFGPGQKCSLRLLVEARTTARFNHPMPMSFDQGGSERGHDMQDFRHGQGAFLRSIAQDLAV